MQATPSIFESWKQFVPEHWLLFVAFYAIVTNVPFWAASIWLGILPIGWFCLEYAGIGLLALFIPRIFAAILLLLFITADLTSAVSKTYYLTPTECLTNVGSLYEFPGSRLLAFGVVAVLILLVTSIVAFFPMAPIRKNSRMRAALCLVAFVVFALSADLISSVRETGQIPNPFGMARPSDANKFSDFRNLWMSRYPTIRLVRNERLFGRRRNIMNAFQPDHSPVPSATALAIKYISIGGDMRTAAMPNVVLVLVESWGLDVDSSVRDSLVRPYSQPDLRAKYDVLQGTVPFYGSTVAGEAQEPCGTKIGSHILEVTANESLECVPDQLTSLGYRSLVLHGMDGHLFSRSNWYVNIGFREQWFRNQFRQEGLPDCMGAFTGTCDAAIAGWIGQRLEKGDENPDFLYWVTLSSHLPVPIPSALQGGASCSLTPLLSQQPTLCSWYQLVANVHDSVSRLSMAKLARPTVLVIVRDHAPPFANPTLRSQFSSTVVPYVVLVPRQKARNTSGRVGD
jgi:hypothetical protein